EVDTLLDQSGEHLSLDGLAGLLREEDTVQGGRAELNRVLPDALDDSAGAGLVEVLPAAGVKRGVDVTVLTHRVSATTLRVETHDEVGALFEAELVLVDLPDLRDHVGADGVSAETLAGEQRVHECQGRAVLREAVDGCIPEVAVLGAHTDLAGDRVDELLQRPAGHRLVERGA